MTLSRVNSKLITSQFYDKIKNCHSLRKVNFEIYDDAHAYLDIIEVNSHVKAWDIHFGDEAITETVKERLAQMLSDKNDNSLFVSSSFNKLDDIPQMTQMFRISPDSYS